MSNFNQNQTMRLKEYTKPKSVSIAFSKESKRLYGLEANRSVAIKDCATEWAKVTGVEQSEFWTRSIPQVLFDTLNSFDREAAYIAAKAYIEAYENGRG